MLAAAVIAASSRVVPTSGFSAAGRRTPGRSMPATARLAEAHFPARDGDEGGDARHREIALAMRVLPRRALTGLGRRDPDLGDHLAVGERGREGTGKELGRRDRPGALRAPHADLGVARGEDGGHLGGRVRVTDVAAQRAAIADRAVRHAA